MRSRIISFTEHPLFEQHLKRLSPEERIHRFNYHISDAQIEQYVHGIRAEDVIIGLFTSTKIIGAAHLSSTDTDYNKLNNKVEVGLSVESEYQNLGLGTELFKASLATCEVQGTKELIIRCQGENHPMIRIVQKFDGKIQTSAGDCYAHIDLYPQYLSKRDKSFGLDYLKTNVFFS